MGDTEFKYWAFISYSHQDKKWGDWLHRKLETYRVPRVLVGATGRGEKIPRRVFPIFRDQEELPTSADLGENINQALKQSRYLIVICSPHASSSRWVNEEILTFKRQGREDRILAIIVDGEPNAGDKALPETDECFPHALKHKAGPDGELTEERTEPIAADVRPGHQPRSDARLKLLAGLLGVDYDRLKQREQVRNQRRLAMVAGASLLLTGVMAFLTLQAVLARNEAERQRAEAEEQRRRAEVEAEQAATAKEKAEDLVLFMLRDVREKLRPLRQLKILDDVIKAVVDYYDGNVAVLRKQSQMYPDDAEIHARLAWALNRAGVTLWEVDRYQDALAYYEEGWEHTKLLYGRDPDNPELIQLMDSALSGLSMTYEVAGDDEKALAMRRERCRLLEASAEASRSLRLAGAYAALASSLATTRDPEAGMYLEKSRRISLDCAAAEPTNKEKRLAAANILIRNAKTAYFNLLVMRLAEELCDESLDILTGAGMGDTKEAARMAAEASARNLKTSALMKQRRFPDALASSKETVALYRELLALHSDLTDEVGLANALVAGGMAQACMDKEAEGLPSIVEADALIEALIEKNPQDASLHHVRMGVLTCLGQTLSTLGRHDEAKACVAKIEESARFIRERAQMEGTEAYLEKSHELIPSQEQE